MLDFEYPNYINLSYSGKRAALKWSSNITLKNGEKSGLTYILDAEHFDYSFEKSSSTGFRIALFRQTGKEYLNNLRMQTR